MKYLSPSLELEEIKCNKCGLSCYSSGEVLDYSSYNGIIGSELIGTYNSTHTPDGDVYKFDLCESCSMKILKRFKISAFVGNYLNPNYAHSGFNRSDYLDQNKVLWENLNDEKKNSILNNAEFVKNFLHEMPKKDIIDLLYRIEYENHLPEFKKDLKKSILKTLKNKKNKDW